MQVTSLLSQDEHEHGPDCGCGHDHEHSVVHLWQAVLGVVCVLNAFIVDWFFEAGTPLASASAMIGAIILIYPIVVTAVKDLRVGRLSINELVAIAVLAAFASGDYKVAGVVAFFMLTGELIETRTAEGARNSIESLIKLTPTKARRLLKDGSEEEVPASQLAVGDVIRIRPGDNVAADGVIISGQGSFNQATITGESLPADKKTGDEVFAGTQNLTGVLEVKVSRAGTDTTLGRVRELIIAAEKTKLPIQKIVDQYMGFYTPLVLVIGALVWAFTHDLSRVIAVFVVSCPCAFILATPTAMVAALSAAARLGILIKNVADIEAAAKINAFIFDKTGTLTTGQLAVNRLAPLGETKPAELLLLAASAEKYSNHPTAKALANLAGEAGVPLAEPKDFVETAGRGVKAEINGAKVLVGRAQWLKDNGVAAGFEKSVDVNDAEGWSLIFVAQNGKCVGWVGMQDRPAPRPGGVGGIEGSRRAPHFHGFGRPPAGGHARGVGDWLRRSQGRLSAAGQGGFRPRRESQGLQGGGGGRRRERRARAGRGRYRHRDGRGGQRSGHPQRDHCADEQRPAPAAVPGETLAQHARRHQPEFPLWRAVHHRRPDGHVLRHHRADRRGAAAQRRFAHRDFQQRAAGAQRRGTGAFPSRNGNLHPPGRPGS